MFQLSLESNNGEQAKVHVCHDQVKWDERGYGHPSHHGKPTIMATETPVGTYGKNLEMFCLG